MDIILVSFIFPALLLNINFIPSMALCLVSSSSFRQSDSNIGSNLSKCCYPARVTRNSCEERASTSTSRTSSSSSRTSVRNGISSFLVRVDPRALAMTLRFLIELILRSVYSDLSSWIRIDIG